MGGPCGTNGREMRCSLESLSVDDGKNINVDLMFMGPCIIFIVE